MLFLGITGGVGAGKSEILAYLREHYNGKVMLADEIAHQLMEPGTLCYQNLRNQFKEQDIWEEDGRINRPQMARLIFSDREKREQLNGIVHPAVKKYVVEAARKAQKEGKLDLLVLEAALLIEEQYDKIWDELWYIYTSRENRKIRLKASRGYSEEKIQNIFASQLPEEEYRLHCKKVIDNNGTPGEAFGQISKLLEEKGIYPLPDKAQI